MAATKTAAPKKQGFQGVRHAIIIIICAFIVGWAFYNFVLGDPSNFANGDHEGHPEHARNSLQRWMGRSNHLRSPLHRHRNVCRAYTRYLCLLR